MFTKRNSCEQVEDGNQVGLMLPDGEVHLIQLLALDTEHDEPCALFVRRPGLGGIIPEVRAVVFNNCGHAHCATELVSVLN